MTIRKSSHKQIIVLTTSYSRVIFGVMKVLLTGGAGFIGSHVAEEYIKSGFEVVILDNLASGKITNIPEGAKFYIADIGAKEIAKIFEIEKPDIVNHHAAQISVTVSARDPINDAKINALGLLNILENSVKNGVSKFIFISSGGAIYGDAQKRPTPEDYSPTPISPYAIHKFLGENYLRFFNYQYGLEYVALRYANVFGPRQDPYGEAGVVAIFINKLQANETPTIYAYPDEPEGMTRDYVYVKDVARANILATERARNTVINIGTGKETKTYHLYQKIAEIMNSKIEPKRGDARPGDIRHSCLDIKRAKEILNWEPETELEDGIRETVKYFKETP